MQSINHKKECMCSRCRTTKQAEAEALRIAKLFNIPIEEARRCR